MNYLVDVNVWFALSYVAHVHHSIARSWFDETEADQAALLPDYAKWSSATIDQLENHGSRGPHCSQGMGSL